MPFFTLCIGDTVEAHLQVCITSRDSLSENVALQLDIPEEFPGIKIAGGDFDESGEAFMSHDGTKSCYYFSILISADTTIESETTVPISVALQNTEQEYCIESDSATSTIQVFVLDCANSTCLCPENLHSINITGNQKWSELVTQPNFDPPYDCWSINGTLTINVFYPPAIVKIGSAEIIMGPAAVIEVSDNAWFSLRESYVHGCDKMWSTIAKYQRGLLNIDENTIEDGMWAINLKPYYSIVHNVHLSPDVRIINNNFNKNFISVNQTDIFGLSNFIEFGGNDFSCEGMSLLPSAISDLDFSPLPQTKSYAGVHVRNAGGAVIIGANPSLAPNVFHHLQNGIIGHRSELNIQNSTFENIPVNNEYQDILLSSGHGIFSYQGALRQKGLGKNSSSRTFYNVATGIKALDQKGTVDVEDNLMVAVKEGIKITNPLNAPTSTIRNNAIYCKQTGVDLLDAFSIQEYAVHDNFIDVSGPLSGDFPGVSGKGGAGIRNNNTYSLDPVISGRFEDNEINVRSFNYGIYVNTAEKIEITHNPIHLLHTGAVSGIHFIGSSRCMLNCNELDGVGTTYPVGRNIGFNVANSTGTRYACNTLENTGIGFRFSGICAASPGNFIETDFRGNTMSVLARGLWMMPDAIFGSMTNENIMVHRGNRWWETFTEHRAIHEGALPQIFYSRFKVHTDDLPYYPASNDPNDPSPATPNALGFTWFQVNSDDDPYSCREQDCPAEFTSESEPEEISSFGLGIAADTFTFSMGYDDAMKWTLKRHLYRILDDYPDLQNQDTLLQNFYSSTNTSPIGQFTAIDHLIAQANQWDSLDVEYMQSWEQEIVSLWDSIEANPVSIQVDSTSYQTDSLLQILKNYLIEIDSFWQLQKNLFADAYTTKLQWLDSAAVINSSITAVSDMEVNEKTVNQVYLDKIARGYNNLDSLEIDTIVFIAYQCPTLGGNAVYRARAILAAIDWQDYYFDDDSLCEASLDRSRKSPDLFVSKAKKALLFPNPANDKIFLQLVAPSDFGKGTIVISDLLGKTQASFTKEINREGIYALPVDGLNPGLYLVHFYLAEHLFASSRLIILR